MQPGPPDPSLGVFETLLACEGRVQALDAHLQRLAASVAELYGAELPADLTMRIQALAKDDPRPRRLRIEAIPTHELLIELSSSKPPDTGGARCHPVRVPGGLGRHKWIDRRLIDAVARAGSTPLFVDCTGELLEAAWANIWVLEDGRLLTPPADGRILPGVTRAMLLELDPAAREEPVTIDRANAADGLFLTSALRHAVPVGIDRPARPMPEVAAIRQSLLSCAWS